MRARVLIVDDQPANVRVMAEALSDTYEIFFANADGSNITRATYLNSFTVFPTWSPDGTTIAFRSDVSGTQAVYKMALDSDVVTLLRSPGNAPDWNP